MTGREPGDGLTTEARVFSAREGQKPDTPEQHMFPSGATSAVPHLGEGSQC